MKLNRRVSFVILPVIIVSYVLIFSGYYYFNQSMYLEHQRSKLALRVSQLSSIYNRYNGFVDTYFSSFMHSSALRTSVLIQDNQLLALAIERRINSVLEDLADIEFNTMNLVLIHANGELKYFFDKGSDPFAEPDKNIDILVKQLFSQRQSSLKRVIVEGDVSLMVKVAVINPLTMKPPRGEDWHDAIAVVLLFDLMQFDQLKAQLNQEQAYQVSLLNDANETHLQHTSYGVHQTERLSPQLILHVDQDDSIIKTGVREIALIAIFSALLLIGFSSLLLIYLIERFITSPIVRLEQDLVAVEDKGVEFLEAGNEHDEISSLKRSFHKVYTELQALYYHAKRLAETDALTQLSNRRIFNQEVTTLINCANENKHFSVAYIDLDNFKFVNDTYGHEAGDSLLKAFAQRLQALMSTQFTSGQYCVARLAGDEFALLIHSLSPEQNVEACMQLILEVFAQGFSCDAGHFPVSASIGVAMYPCDGSNVKELLLCADAAMYQAKQGGKNQCAFYSQALAAKAYRELQLEVELKKRDFTQFTMHYMPVVDAQSFQVIGVEALIRWHSPVLGTVSPAEFIPLAEARGLFNDIDVWVINRVLDDLPALSELYDDELKVSINISSAQLNSEVFFYHLMSSIQGRGVANKHLELEITETFSASMSPLVEANLNLMKQAGFSLALDDFGTGHTALIQLLDYPLDVIKIDKSIIDRVLTDGQDMVLGLIAFCKQQGYFITAEGVETLEQVHLLQTAGVDALQGFYFAKPSSIEALGISMAAIKSTTN